jgi:hypothetical protein
LTFFNHWDFNTDLGTYPLNFRILAPEVYKLNWYRFKAAFIGLKRLATLPDEDKQACIDAYKFFQRMQDEKAKTADLNW